MPKFRLAQKWVSPLKSTEECSPCFGFEPVRAPDAVAKTKRFMEDTQHRWPTNFDLSTVKNEVQLRSIVRDRYGLSEKEAKDRVSEWGQGKHF